MLRVVEEAARTDTGRQRHANEDSYFARSPVFVVADGMGGAQAGEVASRIAADAFEDGLGDGNPEEQLARRAQEANRRIFELAREDSSRSGMGTTLTGALLSDDERQHRARRRQPRLPLSRRRAAAAHPRPLARRGAAAPAAS